MKRTFALNDEIIEIIEKNIDSIRKETLNKYYDNWKKDIKENSVEEWIENNMVKIGDKYYLNTNINEFLTKHKK